MERVQKILSNNGYCSRRKAEDLIKQGRVKVNDKVISIGDQASEKDNIKVDDELVSKEKKLYIVFNKPIGCVTALKDDKYKTVMDYVKIKQRVYPVGRLDYNTQGLLLLTNDGDFANKVMHPRYETKKTYVAELDKEINIEDLKKIEKGIMLEDGKTSPAKANKLKKNIVEITIHEGKNRIVRRILKKLGYKVNTLKRTRIGELTLKNIDSGKYKSFSKNELESLIY